MTEGTVGTQITCRFDLRNRVGLVSTYTSTFYAPCRTDEAISQAIAWGLREAKLQRKTLIDLSLERVTEVVW